MPTEVAVSFEASRHLPRRLEIMSGCLNEAFGNYDHLHIVIVLRG